MGVYDHMVRPSMGHKMQVELRDSMERYYSDKEFLQRHLEELRFRSKELHTEPLSPPPPPLKQWGEPGSRFNQAPDEAAHKARLAANKARLEAKIKEGMEEEKNKFLKPDLKSAEHMLLKGKQLLPPIQDWSSGGTDNKGKDEQNRDKDDTPNQPSSEQISKVEGETKGKTEEEISQQKTKAEGETKTQQQPQQTGANKSPKGPVKKGPAMMRGGKKVLKKGKKGAGAGAQAKDVSHLLKLPMIIGPSDRRSVWDSGRQHLHLQGPSTRLERNQTDEDCRTFRHTAFLIPPIADGKRTEIQRPVPVQQAESPTRVQFRRHLPPMAMQKVADHSVMSRQATLDHFPRHTRERDEEESDDGSEDTAEEGGSGGVAQPGVEVLARTRTSLMVPGSQHQQQSVRGEGVGTHVPPLRLPRGMTPSALSTNTQRSGATYMSLLSQETQEWKGQYLQSDDPHTKGRMLMEILHSTRQRMYDNQEDLRLAGGLSPTTTSRFSFREGEARSDMMLVNRDSGLGGSEATTDRTTGRSDKSLHLPHKLKKQAKEGQPQRQSQNARLHRYLNRLSSQRARGGGGGGESQRSRQNRHVPFHLAAMTIREVTQSSIGHGSNLQTAS